MPAKKFIAIASVFLSRRDYCNNQNKNYNNNFKLMRITVTQMIAHYSVNFDLIQISFKVLAL